MKRINNDNNGGVRGRDRGGRWAEERKGKGGRGKRRKNEKEREKEEEKEDSVAILSDN